MDLPFWTPLSFVQSLQLWYKKCHCYKSRLPFQSSKLQSLRLQFKRSLRYKSPGEEPCWKFTSRSRSIKSRICLHSSQTRSSHTHDPLASNTTCLFDESRSYAKGHRSANLFAADPTSRYASSCFSCQSIWSFSTYSTGSEGHITSDHSSSTASFLNGNAGICFF